MSKAQEIWQQNEESILRRNNDELTEGWMEAKRKDLIEGEYWNRLKLWDEVRSGMWMAIYRERQKAGAAARSTKGTAPSSERARVGRLVKAERIIAGLTLRQLARVTGISRSTLSRIEIGHTWLSVARAILIAEAFGISLDALRPARDSGSHPGRSDSDHSQG